MVLAFLIISMSGKTCGIVYSSVYSMNRKIAHRSSGPCVVYGNSEDACTERGPGEMNEEQKVLSDILKHVYQYLIEDVKSAQHEPTTTPTEASLHPIEKKGTFLLNDTDVPEGVVVWHSFGECCFLLVCDCDENITQAGLLLRRIINSVSSHIVFVTPSEILSKIGLVHAILKVYLPSGKLLFSNQNAVRQNEQSLHRLSA